MVTIRDVAAAVGVSTATVSRALNGSDRIGADTRRRVRDAAVTLGYQPNESARDLVAGRTSTLAVVVPDITNPYFPEMVSGVQEIADRHRHVLCLAQTHDDPDATATVLTQLRRRQVTGFVVVGSAIRGDAAATALTGVPHVAIDRAVVADDAVPVVRGDDRTGGRLATEHLIGLGHEQIAFIGGPVDVSSTEQRRAGFHDALAAAGLDRAAERERDGDFLEHSGYRAVMDLRARRIPFTAVVAANDLMAIGAIRALDECGLVIPGDVSVVGYDDIHLAGYLRPGLTTVHQPIAEMGRLAARMLLEPAEDAPSGSHVLDVHVVRRGSTGPVPETPRPRQTGDQQ